MEDILKKLDSLIDRVDMIDARLRSIEDDIEYEEELSRLAIHNPD